MRYFLPLVLVCVAIGCLKAQQPQSGSLALNWWQKEVDWPDQWDEPVAQVHNSRHLQLGKRWEVGADLDVKKNTRPHAIEDISLVETLQASIPLYLNCFLDEALFLESGIYIGLMIKSTTPQRRQDDNNGLLPDDMRFDGGFVAGVGFRINSIGKTYVRYNHGLLKVVPSNVVLRNYNRMVEVGIAITI